MNIPTKLASTVLVLAAVATTIVVAVPAKPNTDGKGGYVLFTPHAKAVAGICRVVQDKSLCCKTLKHVPSDDPIQLIRSMASAAEAATKDSLKFLSGIKPKYKGKEFAIKSCEKNLDYALEDFADFWKLAGKDETSMAENYFTCKQKMTSIFGYHSTCLDDVNEVDKNLMKEVEGGIGLGKNLSGETLDVYARLNDIFKGFGIKAELNEKETDPLQPPPISNYYY
ncbi:PREDICTED: pectinesterase 5-like [Tarenaya hassleriana]|uniref:pectinesterase 5-like n=1 Tax=Tarenaya hassleriana TaxID=28532 RepID=UPI00053C8FD4|nr:PREDICTED: pectinesterase 5-like [Tarenaya hassleriana]